jgi:uncharacterized protein YukE
MAKINLSIPDELKAQMDALPSRQWSGVAARAFSYEVKKQTLKGENMTEAIERLLASKEEVDNRDYDKGEAAGRNWAMKYASWEGIRAIATLHRDQTSSHNLTGLLCVLEPILEADTPEFKDARFNTDEVRSLCLLSAVLQILDCEDDEEAATQDLITGFLEGVMKVKAEVEKAEKAQAELAAGIAKIDAERQAAKD